MATSKRVGRAEPAAAAGLMPGRLPVPPAGVRERMERHLREEHGIGRFRLDRHVYLGGRRGDLELLSWNPAKGVFRCQRCRGRSFSGGEITAEMLRAAQLFDPGLRPHLAGLAGREEQDAMARAYLDGRLNRERVRQVQGADARRRAARGKRPGVEHRRQRLQAWLLNQVSETDGVLEHALDAAERLQREDPAAWALLSGRSLTRETLRDYWQDIPPATRAQARARGHERAEKSTR